MPLTQSKPQPYLKEVRFVDDPTSLVGTKSFVTFFEDDGSCTIVLLVGNVPIRNIYFSETPNRLKFFLEGFDKNTFATADR